MCGPNGMGSMGSTDCVIGVDGVIGIDRVMGVIRVTGLVCCHRQAEEVCNEEPFDYVFSLFPSSGF